MKFGLSVELSVPRPFAPGAERQVYQHALEYIALADKLGFDQAWTVEHHFLEEYSHSSAPEVFMSAAAMLTERIRLCFGIAVCIPEFQSPVRLAEKAAVLDVISNGRVEVGTGRSGTWNELGGFGVDMDDSKKTWDEYVRMLPKMWTQERFAWDGRCFKMPERAILPKPVQRPHPPLWVAVSSPGTEIDAAERGLGALAVSFGGMAEYEKKVKTYRSIIQHCEPVGQQVNNQFNAVNFLYCHEDADKAAEVGKRLAGSFSSAAAQFMDVKEYPTETYLAPGLLAAIRRDVNSPANQAKGPDGLCCGTPDQIVHALKQWESVGIDRMLFLVNALETVPQDELLASMRLFAEEVMPHFDGRVDTDHAGDTALAGAHGEGH